MNHAIISQVMAIKGIVGHALRWDDLGELMRTEEGGTWSVVHNPERGVSVRVTAADGPERPRTITQFTGSQQASVTYPAGLPFLANCHLDLQVGQGGRRLAVWELERSVVAVTPPELTERQRALLSGPAMQQMNAQLGRLGERVRAGDEDARVELMGVLESWRTSHPDEAAELGGIWQYISAPSPETERAIGDKLNRVHQHCAAGGWARGATERLGNVAGEVTQLTRGSETGAVARVSMAMLHLVALDLPEAAA